jgi:tetratricopeptide (TPR) repeat protein
LQGDVELQRAGRADWTPVTRLDTPLCAGDRLQAKALSRAALFIQPETILRVDQNTTIALNQSESEVFVEFFQNDLSPAARAASACGAGYVITRFPRKFEVVTPHLNAAVEGTEFQVALRCETTELAVFEGSVLATSSNGASQSLSAGQMLVAAESKPAAFSTVIKPQDAVQWVLYYPALSDAKPQPNMPTPQQCRAMTSSDARTCMIQRAEVLLRRGQVDEALQAVNDVLASEPADGAANALRAVIEVAKNERKAAIDSATTATTSSPSDLRTWLALSYAQQASFDLEAALDSAKKARALAPTSSLLNARIAELLMSLGRINEAEAAARAALASNSNESRGHTMLGFVKLGQIDTKQAAAEFQTAIAADSFDPLPRLGLGLSMIRDGELVDGRKQIEVAVALDPANSLLRSYVGKAYYEENTKARDGLASNQFELAKQLDPRDPTPWFYDAVLEQTLTRPVEALADLQKSVELNDNRSVYRSRLLLDEDLAARSARLARSYRELGFDELGQDEGYHSLEVDPADFSAHRFLADILLGRPRHGIARASEALQSQVWQPLDVTPIETQLTDERSFVLRNSGPTALGWNEYNPLFVQQGMHLQANGVVGGNNTRGDELVLSGVFQNASASIGQYFYDSDGFQQGWGVRKSIWSALSQWQLSPEGSIFGEYRDSEQTTGDVNQNFFGVTDPQRLKEDRELYRLGFGFSPGEWSAAGAFTHQDERNVTDAPVGNRLFSSDFSEDAGEVITVYRWSNAHLLVGGGGYRQSGSNEFFGFKSKSDGSAGNGFAYGAYDPFADVLHFEVGVSWDEVNRPDFYPDHIDKFSPKFGVVYRPTDGTTIRAAAFKTLRRSIIADQTLEPTQIAGFNQFFDDVVGTEARRIGLAWDQRLSAVSYAGLEFSKRHLDVPQAFTDPIESFGWDERDYRGYFYIAPYQWLAATIEYTYERITENPLFAENFLDAKTSQVPLSVLLLLKDSGVALRTTATRVRQTGEFRLDPLSPDFVSGTSDFWIVDLALTYQLPARRGLITAEVRNLFDDSFDYQETDIFTPTLARERLAFLRLSLSI